MMEGSSPPGREQALFDQVLSLIPALPDVDLHSIYQEWRALKSPYKVEMRRPPLPVWARRPMNHSGEQAWSVLGGEVSGSDPAKPFCIYIHIPFCANKCGFCDCYSFRLGSHMEEHVQKYLALLEGEMRLWGELGALSRRPVSTVHLGGGTPALLGETALRRLVETCSQSFNLAGPVEWALESTSSELNESMLATLEGLNFSRLHVGVQTLEDSVRSLIKRHEPARTVLEKLGQSVRRGWVASVDLIYGLPRQSLAGLLEDIRTLAEVGVEGFSLYELQVSSRNKRFLEQIGHDREERLKNYFFFQAANRLLERLGYRKTLFNHFAGEKDTNLYFNFPERGEDCLALGTIADGVFGTFHYRHLEYGPYSRQMTGRFPGLQGGLRRNAAENLLQPLEVEILAGKIQANRFCQVLGTEGAGALFDQWERSALIRHDPGPPDRYLLTANGSWLAGNMMEQLTAFLPA